MCGKIQSQDYEKLKPLNSGMWQLEYFSAIDFVFFLVSIAL